MNLSNEDKQLLAKEDKPKKIYSVESTCSLCA
jgi:hypothetical protein